MKLFTKQINRQLDAYQRELIDTHYQEVENMYRQMRGWRHDYRNHIQTIKALAENGDMEAVMQYLDGLTAITSRPSRRWQKTAIWKLSCSIWTVWNWI